MKLLYRLILPLLALAPSLVDAQTNIDAFGRNRVSNPTTIFDSKLTHDASPLIWDDEETAGGGTSSTHNANQSSMTLAVGAEVGTRVRQTFMRFDYHPGKSQEIAMTGILGEPDTGITRRLGYFDADNGVFFESAPSGIRVVVRSNTTGSPVDTVREQVDWNRNSFSTVGGLNPVELDFDSMQIFFIDMEWLGTGTVAFGFIIDRELRYAHFANHANSLSEVYMSTAVLPLRYEISNDGTGAAATLLQVCSTVISEGGQEETGSVRFDSTVPTHVDADVIGTAYAVIGIRLQSARVATVVKMLSASLLEETNVDYEWCLTMNPTIGGTPSWANVTNSSVQTFMGDTLTTVTAGTRIAGGLVKASNQGGGEANTIQPIGAPYLGSAIDGTVDELVLVVIPLAVNADIQGALNWRESPK